MKKYKGLILYGIFGVATTLVNILVYFICSKLFNLDVIPGTIIAWFIAVVFAFITNKTFVFESKTKELNDLIREIVEFFSCRLLTGILDMIIMYVFVSKLHFNDMIIKVFSNVIVIILNYVASKLVIFKNPSQKKNLKFDYKKIFIVLFILGMTVLFLMRSPLNIFQKGISSTDSSVFRYIAMTMSKGYMPYLHFFDHKGPILYLINYFGFILDNVSGIWFIEIIFLFISFLYIYKISRLQTKSIAALIVLMLSTIKLFDYFEGGNLVEEYALFFIIISLYIFIDYLLNNKITKARIIVCGACFSAVSLLRINMIPCWLAFCFIVLIKCIQNRDYKNLLNYIINFIIGILIVALPIFIWLISQGAFNDFIQDYLIFNIKYTTDKGLWSIWHSFFSFSNNIFIIIAGLINIWAIFKEKKKDLYIANLLYLMLSLIMVSLSGRIYSHYGMILIPSFIVPFTYLVNMILNNTSNSLGIVIIIYFLATLVLPNWISLLETSGEYYATKNIKFKNIPSEVLTISDIIEKNSSSNDTITVYGNWDFIYVFSNRLSSSKYSYQFPIGEVNPQILQEYFTDLAINKPKIIVIQDGYNDYRIENFIDKYDYEKLWDKDGETFVYKLSD